MLLIHGFLYHQESMIKPFLMPIEDVFSITGTGTVATGRIERGVITGDLLILLVWELKS